jgi:hypothetical protein
LSCAKSKPLMQKDLFGKKVVKPKSKTKLEISLAKYDSDSFNDRLERLKYLDKIFPKGYGFGADVETVYIFGEAKMAFINGEFISTILLSQAFIERKLQMYYNSIGLDNIANRGLKAITDHAKKNNTIHDFLIVKIDTLRKKRNPFVHLKEIDHEYNLDQRMVKSIGNAKGLKQPFEILIDDAKEAIALMYAIFTTNFG